MGIGQQFVTAPFDNLHGVKGSGLGQGVKGVLNLCLTHVSKNNLSCGFFGQ
jgi:hypothetical protein